MDLDKIDLKMLKLLQEDGRINNNELAQKIHLSPSACWKRLKLLEDKKVIRGYRAYLDAKAINLDFFVYINIALEHHTEEAMMEFEEVIMKIDHIIACHNISGRYDYLLELAVKDMNEFYQLSMLQIRRIGNIKEMNSSFRIREVKSYKGLPLSI